MHKEIDKERAASRCLFMNYDMNSCHADCHLIAYHFLSLTDSSSMLMLAAPCTNPQNLPEQDKPSHPELQKTPSLVPAVAKTSEILVDNKDTGGGDWWGALLAKPGPASFPPSCCRHRRESSQIVPCLRSSAATHCTSYYEASIYCGLATSNYEALLIKVEACEIIFAFCIF